MNTTYNFALNKPDRTELFNIAHWNDNMDKIDDALKQASESGSSNVYEAITIPASGWAQEGEQYVYRKTYTGAILTNVYFSVESLPIAITAGVLPVTSTDESAGEVTIYAASAPASDLTATVEAVMGA